jgi:hypothetical protein
MNKDVIFCFCNLWLAFELFIGKTSFHVLNQIWSLKLCCNIIFFLIKQLLAKIKDIIMNNFDFFPVLKETVESFLKEPDSSSKKLLNWVEKLFPFYRSEIVTDTLLKARFDPNISYANFKYNQEKTDKFAQRIKILSSFCFGSDTPKKGFMFEEKTVGFYIVFDSTFKASWSIWSSMKLFLVRDKVWWRFQKQETSLKMFHKRKWICWRKIS